MHDPTSQSVLHALEASQAWWREAGVDCDFADEPQNWLTVSAKEHPAQVAKKPPSNEEPEQAPQSKVGGDPSGWPSTLTEFDSWWLSETSLSLGSGAPRPAPRGPAGAPLMILVPQPEAEDRDILLSGPQGVMIANMVRAMGFAAETIRVASVLPRHTPGADWSGLAAAGFGELTLHQVALSAPQCLLIMGRNILPLLGADPEQAAAQDSIHAGNIVINAIAGREPATLLAMAPARRALWHRWLERSSDA